MKTGTVIKTILFLVVLSFVGVIAKMLIKKSLNTSPNINDVLVETARQLNKNTPMQIDRYTTINNVGAGDHTLLYNYTITDNKAATYLGKNTEDFKKNLINGLCS